VAVLQLGEQAAAFFFTGTSLVPVTRTRRAAFAHSTILVRYAGSSLDVVLKTRSPIFGSIVSPVLRSSTMRRASARPTRPACVNLRPSPAQARSERS
jgi:hypothetical protein